MGVFPHSLQILVYAIQASYTKIIVQSSLICITFAGIFRIISDTVFVYLTVPILQNYNVFCLENYKYLYNTYQEYFKM